MKEVPRNKKGVGIELKTGTDYSRKWPSLGKKLDKKGKN